MHSATDPDPPAGEATLPGMGYRVYFLLVMLLLAASVGGERYMLVVMVEPIRREFGLSDFAISVIKDLTISLVYLLAVIPIGRLADRTSRRWIVALAALIWSVAVLLCGFARNFWLLLVGRAGIGLGEGAFTPPSQAWIADLFPIRQRGTALSVFLLGSSLGTFIGPAVGGWITHTYGWRHALMVASIPGFVLVPLVWFTLRDPRPAARPADVAPIAFGPAIREIFAIRTLPPLIVAAALNALLTLGLVSWMPAFMERSHGVPANVAGLQLGLALLLGSAVGHTLGGPLADLLGRRDLRWYLWIIMLGGAASAAIGWLILTGPSPSVFPLIGLSLLFGGLSAAPLMAVVAGLAPPHSRATAVAVLMLAIQVVGLGGGPALVGWLSDLLRPAYGEASLGMAMRWALLVGVPSTLLAWRASTTARADFARAGGWDRPRRLATPH